MGNRLMASGSGFFEGLDISGQSGRDDRRGWQPANTDGAPIEISELLRGLWRRRRVLFLCGVLAALAAFGVLRLYPARYSSEGLLLVENREQLPELSSREAAPSAPNNRDHTVIDVLKSRAMLEGVIQALSPTMDELATGPRLPRVVVPLWTDARGALRDMAEHFGLLSPPANEHDAAADQREELVQYLQKQINIDMAESSRIVSIRFETTTPALAAAVVNDLMNTYINADLTRKRELMTQARQSLAERMIPLRQEVEAADQRVQDYRREKNLFRVGAGSLQAVQLGAEQNALSQARQELSKREVALATVQSATRGVGSAMASQEALASPVIQVLRQREAEVSQRLAMANQHLGPTTLDKAALEEELRAVRRQIDTEAQTIVGALIRDVGIARDRVEFLERQTVNSQTLAADSAAAEITLAGLERDADIKRQTYNAFVSTVDHMQLASSPFASARTISPAIAPARAESSHAIVIVLLAFCGGILLAAAVWILQRRLDGKVRSISDLASFTGMPTLGSLPKLTGNMIVAGLEDGDRSPMTETLRAMRVSLVSQKSTDAGTTVLVTSADIAEGKTTVAVALGRRLAADGVKVLLIETDFRRPKLSAMLNLSRDSSLEEVLAGRRTLSEATQIDGKSGLHCLVAAGCSPGPLPMFAAKNFDALIASARRSYQLIILDSPPVLRVADPVLLAQWSDLTLFVVRANRTSFALVREALRRLPDAQRSTVILTLNYVTRQQFDPREYYGGYDAGRGSAAPLLTFGARG